MKSFFTRNLFLSFFLLGVVFPLGAEALEESGITVSPVFQEVTIQEGQAEESFSVHLTNNTKNSYSLRLSVLDFGSLDEAGGVAFLGASSDLEKKYALASWMRPETDTITLDQGEGKDIRVNIENRESLSPGGHYGALVFRVGAPGDEEQTENRVAVNQLFSVLVFAKKIGGEVYNLELQEKEVPHNLFFFPSEARLRFRNTGNVHVIPRGLITVYDPFKREVGRGILNEESSIILPESLRVYPTELLPTVSRFIPGRYTITIDYRYDGKEDFVSDSLVFFHVPKLFTPFIILLVLLAGVLYFNFRRKNKAA